MSVGGSGEQGGPDSNIMARELRVKVILFLRHPSVRATDRLSKVTLEFVHVWAHVKFPQR